MSFRGYVCLKSGLDLMDLSISKSTVKRVMDDLVKNRYIKVEQRYRNSGAKSSLLFTILDFEKIFVPRDNSAHMLSGRGHHEPTIVD